MNSITLSISKNFTVEEVSEFRSAVNKLIEEGTINFIFDFTECEFIDSTGLGVLVSIYKKCAEKNGNIKLRNMDVKVKKLFELTRLDRVFEIY